MIFDNKSCHDIEDEEIDALVREHYQEKQHLEFKATANLKSDQEKQRCSGTLRHSRMEEAGI